MPIPYSVYVNTVVIHPHVVPLGSHKVNVNKYAIQESKCIPNEHIKGITPQAAAIPTGERISPVASKE